MFHTPKQSCSKSPNKTITLAGPESDLDVVPSRNVRRSIGEWETGRPEKNRSSLTPPSIASMDPSSQNTVAYKPSVGASMSPSKPSGVKTLDKVAEARSCLIKAKQHINNSRNLKTEIKNAVLQAVERLYQLVKESNSVASLASSRMPAETSQGDEGKVPEKSNERDRELKTIIEKHMLLLKENGEKMQDLKTTLEGVSVADRAAAHAKTQNGLEAILAEVHGLRQTSERMSYAGAAATPPKAKNLACQTSLHSVIVGASDEMETGEEVLNRIRKVVNAKEGGVAVERIRKAKDAKIIMACRTEEERQKLKAKLSNAKELTVEEIKNKDPLVILRDVLQYNTDEEVLRALRNQNKSLFDTLEKQDQRCEVAYKKRTRNPHTGHVVLRVSPKLWQAMVVAETVHIDLQRVKVADQSPLVQCSLCLGYGHGRRFCKETLEKCSHCGGPHLKAKCADWLANAPPSCCNCVHAKLEKCGHNAFSDDCVIRKKWEALARATVAYC